VLFDVKAASVALKMATLVAFKPKSGAGVASGKLGSPELRPLPASRRRCKPTDSTYAVAKTQEASNRAIYFDLEPVSR
jgi:hypothetical protein